MVTTADSLSIFDPVIADWFAERVGTPTEVQRRAWPVIAAGEHALVTAPTGSGKTLAAFLWALDRLLTGGWESGRVRVLYVSPLRALGNDIRRNLTGPLTEIQDRLTRIGRSVPEVRVMSRTGDTSAAERRQINKSPPEILITTPESLNILLTSKAGRRLLENVESLILDEVHAVVDSKRGVHLMTAVERLVGLSGEIQRVALSATVNPPELIARWVGGYRVISNPNGADFQPRRVITVVDPTPKKYELDVALPVDEPGASRDSESLWADLTAQLKRTIRKNRSTLVFGNSKRTVEKVARFLNEDEPSQLAYSHHGALSREIRSVVEERLKAGTLKAIVATNSLELGIDIGTIDEVAMVQPPATVASTTQRLGRSGHGVGETSRGRLYPLHAYGLIESAVLVRSVLDGDLEPSRPVTNPLDVLAQVLLSMTVRQRWPVDELFDSVRASEAFRRLQRNQFDLVLDMLAGRYQSTRLRTLRPLVTIDGVDNTVEARPGAERLIYMSGGTIPDRGYFTLRVDGSGAPLGQLDEEFVWERSVGDTFTLGVQTWRVHRITHNDVFVTAVDARSAMAPFWRAEERDRSSFLSERIGAFLEKALDRLDDDDFVDELTQEHKLQPPAAAELRSLLAEQVAATGTLPHRHQIVVEHTKAPSGRTSSRQIVLHTVWGGQVNRPLGYALAAAWAEAFNAWPEVIHGDDCVVITHPVEDEPDDPFSLVSPDRIEELLRRSLENTGFFGARFREAAGRSLLLPRGGGRRRTPLWLNRQRAKELLEVVSKHGDFPLVLEAWRECLHDEFEIDALRDRLDEVADGRIAVRHVHTDTPSPFTEQVAWRQTNTLMYEDDQPSSRSAGGLRADLVRELAFASHLRPKLAPHLVDELQGKLHRTEAGYAPRTSGDLLEWVKERRVIPGAEWRDLLTAIERDHDVTADSVIAEIEHRVVAIDNGGPENHTLICAVENIPLCFAVQGRGGRRDDLRHPLGRRPPTEEAIDALDRVMANSSGTQPIANLAAFISEWLAFYGPVSPDWIAAMLNLPQAAVVEAVEELAAEQTVVLDRIVDGAQSNQVCDLQNLERLLRMARAAARPVFRAESIDALPLFLATHQGLGNTTSSVDDLKSSLEHIFGWSMPPGILETEILPARLDPYLPSWLDTLFSETDLEWFGCGAQRISIGLGGDRGLFVTETESEVQNLDDVFPSPIGRFTLTELLRYSSADSHDLMRRLWDGVWQGLVSTDTFAPVRQGAASGFKGGGLQHDARATGRRRPRFDRWRSQLPMDGTWYRLPPPHSALDALDQEEDDRERARMLLDRYGIVFRELLQRESPNLKWGAAFRSFRMLELAGEVVAGRFFDDVPGLQFMSRPAFRTLENGPPEDRIWWLNATDPASPCGLGGIDFPDTLPKRIPSNHLVYHGRKLVLVSRQRGARLDFQVAPDHPLLEDYLAVFRSQLGRPVQPRRSITIETINDEPAASSPYREALNTQFHVTRTPTALKISRRY